MKTLINIILIGIIFCFFGCTKTGYEGATLDGKPHGNGTYTWSNGVRYEGEWKDGKWNGQGTSTLYDGGKYEGEFKDGKRTGQGTYTWSDGRKYVGEFKDGRDWNTTEYDKNRNITGKYVNGIYIKQ